MQFTYQIDPRIGQWLALASFVLSMLAMASWWQDFFTAKEVAAGVGVMNLSVSAINYVLHGMPPLALPKPVKALVLFALAFLALNLATPAKAQTAPAPVLATKAKTPTISNVYPVSGCGAFYGLAAEGSNGVISGAPAGTVQIGGDIGGLVGYACPTSGVPWFAQFKAEFQNLNAGNAGFALKGPAHLEEMLAVQTPLLQWFAQWINVGQSQTPALSSLLPPGVTQDGASQNYVGVVLDQDDISDSYGNSANRNWINSFGIRTGLVTNLLGPNGTKAVGDTFVQLNFKSTPLGCIGPSGSMTCPKFGDGIRVGWEVKM
jgi:hypothetical protein